MGGNAQTHGVYYFSALAHHLSVVNPGVVQRHKRFIKCLESTGVTIQLARFKEKDVKFRFSNAMGDKLKGVLKRHEEKETDVAIAAKLFELFINDECDTAVLVTGDTDLAPAVKVASQAFPNKTIGFAFPYRRKTKELASLVPLSFVMDGRRYVAHQFPDPVTLLDGRVLSKPPNW